MRIGTWNVDNRLLTDKHKNLIVGEDCDVWLITELRPESVKDNRFEDFHFRLSKEVMGRGQSWASVLSIKPFDLVEENEANDKHVLHPATRRTIIDGITYCSTILPWRGSGGEHPWLGDNHAARTQAAIKDLLVNLPTSNLVWGGDWNHSLLLDEVAGSIEGRKHLHTALKKLKLQVPTAGLMHRDNICHAIDHIAVPIAWNVRCAKRVIAKGLSDHDAYIVDVAIPDF